MKIMSALFVLKGQLLRKAGWMTRYHQNKLKLNLCQGAVILLCLLIIMVAAAQIYNMLMEYKGDVTVKVDRIAASAASVITMAGTKVLMSPMSSLMIHNPMATAFRDTEEMQKAISMLSEIKKSILNAYQLKTVLSRAKIS